jgi:hypothetical protein
MKTLRHFPLGLRGLSLSAAAFAAAGLTGCLQDDSAAKAAPIPGTPILFALTSDYHTGSYSVFGIDSDFAALDIAPIHSDAVIRYCGGSDIYVINRLGRDNIQVIDRHNLQTVMQIDLADLSNPYDVAVKDSLIYVAEFASAKIEVFGQNQGDHRSDIDLSAFADTSDGLPETTELAIIDGYLYALAANLDAKNTFAPLTAKLIRYDLSKKTFASLDLPFGNPVNMAWDSAGGKLYIPCRGVFLKPDYSGFVLDGGIATINLSDFTVGATVATEEALNGSLNKAVFHDGGLYMDLSTALNEKIVSISVGDGAVKELGGADSYKVSGIALDAKAATLFIGDRKLGLRAFNLAADGAEKALGKASAGALPISDIAVIR